MNKFDECISKLFEDSIGTASFSTPSGSGADPVEGDKATPSNYVGSAPSCKGKVKLKKKKKKKKQQGLGLQKRPVTKMMER